MIVLKSGSLNLLEPSGPVQACNGIALPFYHDLYEEYDSCFGPDNWMENPKFIYAVKFTQCYKRV